MVRKLFISFVRIPAYKSAKDYAITALAYDDALTLGVGTHTGQVCCFKVFIVVISLHRIVPVGSSRSQMHVRDLEGCTRQVLE